MKYINFLIKPASSLCQLRCRYCFYEDIAEKREHASMGIMSRETAHLLIDRAYEAAEPGGMIGFAFQGGEPTLAGLDFFRDFVAYANAGKPAAVNIAFSIQTNGMVIDDEWAKFFHDNSFLVGISMDGNKDLHDMYRVDAAGKETWNRVAKGLNALKKQGCMYNALCVVTSQCARSPQKVYDGLKKQGVEYMQFISCLDPIGVERGSLKHSLTPDAYGKFLCRLFDMWFDDWQKGQYRSVRLFDDHVHMLTGRSAGTCSTCGKCGSYFVVEGDGSVYPCDFFVLDKWRMGTLQENTLDELAGSETAKSFLEWGTVKPAECANCPWQRVCNGGCKNDWVYDENGAPHNYFCSSFKQYFEYAAPRLNYIAQAEIAALRR